jgi:hypothetical protein
MAKTPVVVGTPAADLHPGADDADQDEDHADEDDEVSGVLSQREARDSLIVHVRDEVVLDEVEEQAEGHDRQAEPGETREGRAGGER